MEGRNWTQRQRSSLPEGPRRCCPESGELRGIVGQTKVALEGGHVEDTTDQAGIPAEKETPKRGADAEDIDTPVLLEIFDEDAEAESSLGGIVGGGEVDGGGESVLLL